MSLKQEIYEGLKEDILNLGFDLASGTSSVKTVALWRNNLVRESDEIPFLCPAVLVEFLPADYMESSSKAYQEMRFMMRLHLIFESYKTEDLDVFAFEDAVYTAVQGKQYGYSGKLKRRSTTHDWDHNNLQDIQVDYDCGMGKDYGADARPTTPATITTVNITTDIVDEIEE